MSSRASANLVSVAGDPPMDEATVNVRATTRTLGNETRMWALQLALVSSLLFWVVAWHWDTAASMALIWWRSETFAHGIIVYPISIWLIWRVRSQLQAINAVPAFWVLILLAGASFGWLLGELGGVQAARHFGLVAMIALVVWVTLGTRIALAIAFPLAFTLLAVPIGEFLLPVLIEHTADFTVGALRLSGIPVYREGNNFVVPTGGWSVVEACSGLRYLIASITLGLLYSYLSYTSLLRRGLFVLASIIVPIVANWLRAYMIVMIGHLSGMKYAVGVDHLLYGWVFFGLVMLILFWAGSFWRQDIQAPSEQGTPAGTASGPSRSAAPASLFAACLTAALVTVAPSYSEYRESPDAGHFISLALPTGANGWRTVDDESLRFRPHYVGSRSTLDTLYERDGQRVGLYIAYYAQQREGAEMISSQNVLVAERDRTVNQISQRTISNSRTQPDVIQTRLRSSEREFIVWHWYWLGDGWMLDPRLVKMRQAVNKLMGKGDDAAVVMLYARSDGSAGEAEKLLRDFSTDMAGSIAAALTTARAERVARRQGLSTEAR
jgi:exosortase A